jgi:hypothetical protein
MIILYDKENHMKLEIPQDVAWTPFSRSPIIYIRTSRDGETEENAGIVSTFFVMFTNALRCWEDILRDLKNMLSGQPYDETGFWNDWGIIEYGSEKCLIKDGGLQNASIYTDDLIVILEQALQYFKDHP